MVNDKGKQCITGYHNLGDATKKAHIKRKGYMVNDKGTRCITGYHNLGYLGGAGAKDKYIQREGYMVNDKGTRCSTAYQRLSKKGVEAKAKISAATAMGEHHSHICISAIRQRGASIKWEDGLVRMYHHCYYPEQSGLVGQKPRQVRGLGLHVCKNCHRTARECNEASFLVSACSSNSLKLCEHLH